MKGIAARIALVAALLLGASTGLALSAGKHGQSPRPFPKPPSAPPSSSSGGSTDSGSQPGQQPVRGARAPATPHGSTGSGPQALINMDSISGSPSLEEQEASADGFGVTVVDGATWDSMTAAQFASYQVLIVGDPACGTLPASVTSNASTWAPVVMGTSGGNTLPGNRVLIGTDPVYHEPSHSGALKLIKDGIAFAGALAGRTGIYLDSSCADNGSLLSTLDMLSVGSGSWTENSSPPCGGSVSIIATNSAFSDMGSSDLQGWSCSDHETFPSYRSDWTPFAIATDTPTKPTCGTDISSNTPVCGESYILLAGQNVSTSAPNISVAPSSQTLPAGTNATVTATVTDPSNNPVAGQLVTFTVTGQNNGATGTCSPSNCQTDVSGNVSFTYTGSNGAGQDTVAASFTSGGTTQQATAAVTWTSGGLPNVPTLLTPADGSTLNANQPQFTWMDESASGAASYEIQIAAVGGGGGGGGAGSFLARVLGVAAPATCDFTSPGIDTTTTGTSFTPSSALADGTYCWRVQSLAAGGGTQV